MSAEVVAERWMAEKTALDALLTYANEATQAGDTDIGEAIRTLVDGYGKGGGGNPKVFVTDFTPTGASDYGRTYPITHNLGTTDVTVVAWLKDTNGITASSSSSYHMLGYFYSEMADMAEYTLSNGTTVPVGKNALLFRKAYSATSATPSVTYSSTPFYGGKDANSVDLYASNGNWRSGWTYRIVVIDNSILDNTGGGSGGIDAEWSCGKIIEFTPEEDTATVSIDIGLPHAPHVVFVSSTTIPPLSATYYLVAVCLNHAYNSTSTNVTYAGTAVNATYSTGVDYWSNAFNGSFVDGILTLNATRNILFCGGVTYRLVLGIDRNDMTLN